MIKIFLSVCVCFILCSPAHAARFSGDYLLQMCAMDKDGNEIVRGGAIACQAYISGILDYHALIKSLGVAPSVDFCVPTDLSLNVIHLRVASYIYNHKHEQGPFIASPGVTLALHKMYPCK